jgi:hypothetical protein
MVKGLGLATLIVLTASAAAAQPAFNETAALGIIRQRLESRFATGYGNSTMPCRQVFEILGVRITDKRVEGATARVEAAATIRSKAKIDRGAFASTGCYGDLANGWHVGETATDTETFRFERWESGWRLGP